MNLNTIQQTMSSREIAEVTGKTHDNVLKAIRNMESAWVKVTGVNFNVSEYKDSTGRKLPMYELDKKECLYVATKFNDEVRAKLILRWEELERQQRFHIPQTMSEALRLAAEQAEQIEVQNKKLLESKTLLEKKSRKEDFADRLIAQGDYRPVSIIAKRLHISAEHLNKFLNEKGVIYRVGEVWVLNKKYDGLGYAKLLPVKCRDGIYRDLLMWSKYGEAFVQNLYSPLTSDSYSYVMEPVYQNGLLN